ncbi:MAG TPA: PIN domain-containing protein, partial [Alphaproteobacteria bacterium]|nr:PIN domain-containing protein [Alphaproteobacteria bacterium]
DFENTQKIDFSKMDSSIHVYVFVGAHQKNMPIDIAIQNQKLGSRLEWKRINGSGKNALDFYIAYYIGKTLEKDPAAECIILSKDTGFDPLLAALRKENKKAQRIEDISALKS